MRRMLIDSLMLLGLTALLAEGELLRNGGFESMTGWSCNHFNCTLIANDKHSGHHALMVSGRHQYYQGPTQVIHLTQGHTYHVSGYIKLLNDHGNGGQRAQIEVALTLADNSKQYMTGALRTGVRASDGWVHLTGTMHVPDQNITQARLYYQGPDPEVNFIVDDASVTELVISHGWRNATDTAIDQYRKSDIHIHVTAAAGINKADVQIHVLQTKKSFPFGTAIKVGPYNDPSNHKYRDFVHKHFNWAVCANALKWPAVEHTRGHYNYQPPLDAIHGLRRHGLKVRGHNIVWSVEKNIQPWVKQLSGDELRSVVKQHIEMDMNVTRGLLEHWDVNNENLHGQWFQDRLHDPDYNLEIFHITHNADPNVKLFLNDFGVVSHGYATDAYLKQARQFKAANVGLYGMGVQSHFGNEQEPNPDVIKQRLDTLSQAGVPIWVTELDVMAQDENKRADYIEKALRALYGHPAVEGIIFWGFDEHNWRGDKAALVMGSNLELTAAGRRVLDLLENQWMTDETHVLSQSGDQFTVRGFHGDYEVHVIYKGEEKAALKKSFQLGKNAHTVSINVHG